MQMSSFARGAEMPPVLSHIAKSLTNTEKWCQIGKQENRGDNSGDRETEDKPEYELGPQTLVLVLMIHSCRA
jgi:hypothetical protein